MQKPIGHKLGFYSLMFLLFLMTSADNHVAASVYATGAVIFDAIKSIGK